MTDSPAAPLAPLPPAGAPIAPEAAQAEIARRKSDPAAFLATDPAAMSELFKAAYPEQSDTAHVISLEASPSAPAAGAAPETPAPIAAEEYGRLPFKFAADTPLPHVQETQAWARDTAAALGFAVPLAHGAVKMLDEAVTARQGRAMDRLELAELDAILDRRWGAEHSAKAAAVRTALARAGKGAERLRQSILASGPVAAAWAFETLAAHQARTPG